MASWDADQYLRFVDQRTRACHDLIERIQISSPRRIIDLGCGPGNSTTALAVRWPEAEITGVDNSPTMITAATQAHPELSWISGDIADWTANDPCDLVFSNAALQWVPHHQTVIPHLARQVISGGVFAFQVPIQTDSPARRLMQELAYSKVWENHLTQPVREWLSHEPAFYYDLLAPLTTSLDIWTTQYVHVMESVQQIVEWYKGTGLRPFLDLLSADDQKQFLSEYQALLATAYPVQTDGRVLFPFPRLFLVANIK